MSKIRFSELEKTLNYSGLEECDGQSKCAIDGIVKTRFEKAENSENLEIQNKSIKIIKSPNLELKQFMDSILSNLDDINYIKNFIARFDLNKEYYSKFSPNLYLLKCSPRRLQEEIRSAEIAKYQLFELSNILETEEVDTSQI